MRRLRRRMGLNLVLFAVLAWLPLGAVPRVAADHPHEIYLESIRSNAWHETTCVDTEKSYVPWQRAHDMVIATLVFENPGGDWHGLNDNKVFFEDVWWTQCRFLNYSTSPRLSDIEVKFYAQDAPDHPQCGGTSCAVNYGYVWSTPAGSGQQYYDVYLRSEPLNADGDRRRHLVNHEVGHVLGLRDGGPNSPYPVTDSRCYPQIGQTIMHTSYYGCPANGQPNGGNLPWPSGNDIHRVWWHFTAR